MPVTNAIARVLYSSIAAKWTARAQFQQPCLEAHLREQTKRTDWTDSQTDAAHCQIANAYLEYAVCLRWQNTWLRIAKLERPFQHKCNKTLKTDQENNSLQPWSQYSQRYLEISGSLETKLKPQSQMQISFTQNYVCGGRPNERQWKDAVILRSYFIEMHRILGTRARPFLVERSRASQQQKAWRDFCAAGCWPVLHARLPSLF